MNDQVTAWGFVVTADLPQTSRELPFMIVLRQYSQRPARDTFLLEPNAIAILLSWAAVGHRGLSALHVHMVKDSMETP